MLLTEEEAKEKQCPYKPMTYVTPGFSGEDVPQWTSFDTCSGSECMAWRWDGYGTGPNIEEEAVGFCGLAGRVTQ